MNINIYCIHYIIKEDYWTHTNTHTNRLGQKTPLIKVSHSKQRPNKHFLGTLYYVDLEEEGMMTLLSAILLFGAVYSHVFGDGRLSENARVEQWCAELADLNIAFFL